MDLRLQTAISTSCHRRRSSSCRYLVLCGGASLRALHFAIAHTHQIRDLFFGLPKLDPMSFLTCLNPCLLPPSRIFFPNGHRPQLKEIMSRGGGGGLGLPSLCIKILQSCTPSAFICIFPPKLLRLQHKTAFVVNFAILVLAFQQRRPSPCFFLADFYFFWGEATYVHIRPRPRPFCVTHGRRFPPGLNTSLPFPSSQWFQPKSDNVAHAAHFAWFHCVAR